MKYLLLTLLLFISSCSKSQEEQLQDLLNWQYSPDMSPAYDETFEETAFKQELQKVLKEEDFKFCYSVNLPNYFILHVLPYFHVLPGPLCGVSKHAPFRNFETPESMRELLEKRGYSPKIFQIVSSYDVLKKFMEGSKKHVVVGALRLPFSSDPHTMFIVSHGVDEDQVYYSAQQLDSTPRKSETSSLLFTRFVEKTLSASPEDLKSYYQLDPTKQTIFYTGTYGPWEFLEVGVAPEHTWKKTYQGLMALKNNYNIIYRPHPQLADATLDLLRKDLIIAPSSRFPSFAPFYDVADLVIGPISSTTSAATSRPNLPMVLLRPTVSWPWGLGSGAAFEKEIYQVAETAKKNKGFVLGEDTCVVQDENNVDLATAVNEAFATNTSARIDSRKKYFNYWFGCIDGYEEYREIITFLEGQGVNMASLKDLYRKFPVYKGRPLCL
jgi:hypothetical protein